MAVSLAHYAEQKKGEAGESAIPSGIRKRWRERIVANGWHEMGEEGAAKYLDRYGQNIGAPKVIQFARQAEAEGCSEMAQGFWLKAYELELGHAPPADDVHDKPAPVPVPPKLTESDIKEMKARKDIGGLTKALYYRSPDRVLTWQERRTAHQVRLAAASYLIQLDHVHATKALVKALKDDDARVRASAAEGLANRICSAQAVDPLLEALKDDSPDVRRNTALALGRAGDVGAVDALIAALKDDDSWVRSYAAGALRQLGDVRAVDALIAALKDHDSWVKRYAAGALGQLGDVRATEALREATQDRSQDVKESAVRALDRLSKPDYGEKPTKQEVEKMEARKDVAGLIQALHWLEIRREVISALGRLGDPSAADALIQVLQEDGSSGTFQAIEALGEIGGERAEAALVDVLKNGTKFKRLSAARELGRMGGGPRAVDALSDALQKDADLDTRLAVVEALGQMGAELCAVDALLRALKDDADPRVRLAVVEVLGQIGDSRAAAAFVQAIKEDTDLKARRCATEALQLLEGDRAIEAVAQLLQDDDEHAREHAAREWGWLGGPQAKNALASTLNDEAEGVRQAVTHALAQFGGVQVVAALLGALRDDAGQVRIPTVAALGKIGNEQAVPALIEVLKDDSGLARAAAAQALGQIRDERAVPVLLEALQDEAEEVRTAAVQALGQIGDERAVDALVAALADTDCAQAATWALEQIGGVRAEKALQASAGPSRLRLYPDNLPAELAESFQAEFGPFQDNIEATIQPYIAIRDQLEDRVILWHSKFGGRPYLPQGTPYPTTSEGRYLFLLAQINFAQVPRLEPFPQEGILQFYIADDGQYGMNYDDLTTQEGFRVLFFPEVVEDEKELVTDLSFLPKPAKFPISKPHSLTFARRYAPISVGDYRFESTVFGKDFSPPEEKIQVYERIISSYGDRIGGYPHFVTWHDRYDPRKKKVNKKEDYEILLLQTSDTWFGGEWGMLRFFIREQDLRKRDFSRVMYYCDWDID